MNDEQKNETEIKDECEYKQISKDDIEIPKWIPRKPEMKTQEDLDLSGSIKEVGLLNPITVRPTDNGKFELMAGSRRLAASGEKVWVGIQKNTSEYGARRICGNENFHRSDVKEVVRDDFYYQTYLMGIEEGEIKSVRDMAHDFSMKLDTLRKYISAGEERAKHKDDNIIGNAPTSVLCNTKKLNQVKNLRKKILEMEAQKIVTQKNISEITKRVETCIDKGMTEKMIIKMIDMSIPKMQTTDASFQEIGNKDNAIVPIVDSMSATVTSSNNQNSKKNIIPFNMDEFDTISSVMAISHPDVRDYIISKKIDIKDASEINRFESVEARQQLVEEKLKIDKWKKRSEDTLSKEWNNNLEIRKQQAQDMKENGNTNLKTRFDVDLQQKLDLAKNADNRHDEDFLQKYRNLKDGLNRTILYFHPNKMKTDKGKESAAEFLRNMYAQLRLVMIEIGEIKTGTGEDDFFGRHYVDIEAKVAEETKT